MKVEIWKNDGVFIPWPMLIIAFDEKELNFGWLIFSFVFSWGSDDK